MGEPVNIEELLIYAPPQGGNKVIFESDEGDFVTSVSPEDLVDLNAVNHDKRTFTTSFADSVLDLTDLEIDSAIIDGGTVLDTNYGEFSPVFDSSGVIYSLVGDGDVRVAEEQLRNSEKARIENRKAFALGESFELDELDYSPKTIDFDPEHDCRLDYHGTFRHPSGRTLVAFSDGEVMFSTVGTSEENYQKQHSPEMGTDYHTTHSLMSEFAEEFELEISISLDKYPSEGNPRPHEGQVQITHDGESIAYEADENTLSAMSYLADEIYVDEKVTQDLDEVLD